MGVLGRSEVWAPSAKDRAAMDADPDEAFWAHHYAKRFAEAAERDRQMRENFLLSQELRRGAAERPKCLWETEPAPR
jgi:hypothetical protein